MNTNLSALHDVAMEFVDEARFSAQKGDEQTARLFFQKAFNLEKMVSLAMPKEAAYQLSRSVFLRSAASLALDCERYAEAQNLAETALSTEPHPALQAELKAILKKARQGASQPGGSLSIVGTLVAADIPGNQIKIQTKNGLKFFTVYVPSDAIGEVVKSHWNNLVSVQAIHGKNGAILLEGIQKAA